MSLQRRIAALETAAANRRRCTGAERWTDMLHRGKLEAFRASRARYQLAPMANAEVITVTEWEEVAQRQQAELDDQVRALALAYGIQYRQRGSDDAIPCTPRTP